MILLVGNPHCWLEVNESKQMADTKKIIESAIREAVQKRITGKVETFVRDKVLAELRRQGVTDRRDPKEAHNKTLPLVAQENLRKQIGSLVMTRVKGEVTEQIRFKLNGVQARRREDAINMKKIEADVKASIIDAIKKGILKRF